MSTVAKSRTHPEPTDRYAPIEDVTPEERERCLKEFGEFLRLSPDVIRDGSTPPPELEAQAAKRERRAQMARRVSPRAGALRVHETHIGLMEDEVDEPGMLAVFMGLCTRLERRGFALSPDPMAVRIAEVYREQLEPRKRKRSGARSS